MNTLVKAGLIVMLVGVCVFAGFAGAAVYYQLNYPSTAEGQTVEVTAYLNGELWANNATIDWQEVNASSSYEFDFNIHNTGQLKCIVTVTTTGLPSDWTQVWSENDVKLAPNAWANGTLTLTTGTVKAIPYNWNTIIEAQQT